MFVHIRFIEGMSEDKIEALCSKYVKNTYIHQGRQNISHRNHILHHLLEQHKLPKDGLDDNTIEFILHELSTMDSNNFYSNIGVGEREGRVFSSLVHRRHYSFAHGIGRSGDLTEVQPKAAGSSLLYKLCNHLALEAIKLAGVSAFTECTVIPLATGMTISLILTAIGLKKDAKIVLWSRIDQKSCFKAILAAGMHPIIIDPIIVDGRLETNIDTIQSAIIAYGSENILAIISTTSCFAPRQPDRIDDIAKLCSSHNIHHVINNAYGLQSMKISKLINRACVVGRVDAVVQSTDKNFLVPVGGAIICCSSSSFMASITSTYPGRANASPIIDLFITLLSMGENGYRKLLSYRATNFELLRQGVLEYAERYSGRLLDSPGNEISIAVDLPFLSQSTSLSNATFFGSMLFQREVSGCRVIAMEGKEASINEYRFLNWGSHINHYPASRCYFTVAAAIGMKSEEIKDFLVRLDKITKKYQRKLLTSEVSSSISVVTQAIDQQSDGTQTLRQDIEN
jgi:O-phospho-L-seryl-tRNASec:L-selenocysteinyl-tRNA synthase